MFVYCLTPTLDDIRGSIYMVFTCIYMSPCFYLHVPRYPNLHGGNKVILLPVTTTAILLLCAVFSLAKLKLLFNGDASTNILIAN